MANVPVCELHKDARTQEDLFIKTVTTCIGPWIMFNPLQFVFFAEDKERGVREGGGGGGGGGERERERERERDRQTDRQTDRLTDRQTDRQTDRRSDRQTESGRERKVS